MKNAPDLTQRPPRSPRVRLGGFVILPRMLDKGRATGVSCADGSAIAADAVVSAADRYATLFSMLDSKYLPMREHFPGVLDEEAQE